jgi:putative hydrolase of the HAD superfamily
MYHHPNLSRLYESGQITSDEFYKQCSILCAVSMTKPAFRRGFTNIFTRIQPTLDLVRLLKPHYKLGVLSNTNPWDFEDEIMTLDVFPLFDAVTASYVVGAMKPERRIYQDIIQKMRLSPDECIYIDDIELNVEGAARLGIHSILYTSHQELLTSLRERGVNW